jgi:hypothetical protein
MKQWLPLVDWFDRPRTQDTDVIPPIAVTSVRAREARRYLQQHSKFDFERFRSGIEVDRLMRAPLGQTPQCLSADDLASMVQSHALAAPVALAEGLVARGVAHIEACETCFQNIMAYQEMEHRSVEDAMAKGVENLPPVCWIGPVGRVEIIENAEPALGLALTMHRDQAWRLRSAAEMRVRISWPFETEDVTLHPVELAAKRSWLAPWRRSRGARVTMKESGDFVQGFYRTDRLEELNRVRDRMCSFVTLSQGLGNEEIRSTQIIRFEKGYPKQ